MDGGQPRDVLLRRWEIVIADDAHVLWDSKPLVNASGDGPLSADITGTDNGCDAVLDKLLNSLFRVGEVVIVHTDVAIIKV